MRIRVYATLAVLAIAAAGLLAYRQFAPPPEPAAPRGGARLRQHGRGGAADQRGRPKRPGPLDDAPARRRGVLPLDLVHVSSCPCRAGVS
ncbi:hypothetical protein WLU97_24335, partial [Bordetella bronchiseptica]